MDIRMDWEKTRELGPDSLLKFLQAMVPHFGLCSISVDWMKTKEYIAKARGVHGDVVISWY